MRGEPPTLKPEDTMDVRVEMDQAFSFWFTTGPQFDGEEWSPSLKIDYALYTELQNTSKAYMEALSKVEQLYRIQEGLKPWESEEVPFHNLITPST
jgi:hypothetical protein